MIKIPDRIIHWLQDISETELKTYLVINRYITEEEVIIPDKITKILGINNSDLIKTLDRLVKTKLIAISQKNKRVFFVDRLTKEKTEFKIVSGCFEKASGRITPLDLETITVESKGNKPIYSQKEQTKKTSKKINKKKETSESTIHAFSKKHPEAFHAKFNSVIKKLSDKSREIKARRLVDHFTTSLYDITGVSRPKRWRNTQMSIAKRLFKEHELSLQDWMDAIDWFVKQDFWKDKLNSLLMIEKHLNQWAYIAKQRKTAKKKVEIEEL